VFTKSTSSGMNHSTSRNEQIQKMPLMTIDEVLKLDQGECVFINPAYKGGREASVPLRLKLVVPKADVKIQEQSERLWRSTVRDRLIQTMQQLQIPTSQIDAATALRQKVAEELFPLEAQEPIYRVADLAHPDEDYTEM
jgi:type IV secretion system protein VirD4